MMRTITFCRTSSNTRRSFSAEHNGDFERILIEFVRTLMNSGKCCVIIVPPQVISISNGAYVNINGCNIKVLLLRFYFSPRNWNT